MNPRGNQLILMYIINETAVNRGVHAGARQSAMSGSEVWRKIARIYPVGGHGGRDGWPR